MNTAALTRTSYFQLRGMGTGWYTCVAGKTRPGEINLHTAWALQERGLVFYEAWAEDCPLGRAMRTPLGKQLS